VGNIDGRIIVRYAECMSTDSRCDKYRTCRTRQGKGDSFSIFSLEIIDNCETNVLSGCSCTECLGIFRKSWITACKEAGLPGQVSSIKE
jgi:hypothetical protein